ncbi:MAG: hypothetical protein Q4A54_09955 [Parabacteroides sp.]|nr:hypothetical protein [Parabacteroides sp.]
MLGNESPDSNRFTLVTPKSENDVRLQATLGNQNPKGLPVGAVRSDNANKLGTSMDSVIETYQSLARGNYEMLDNNVSC